MNSPFDSAKYSHLLEGLEISIVNISTVLKGTQTHRFDPEYFQKKHIEDEAVAINKSDKFSSFEDLGLKVDASAFYPAIEEFYGSGELPFLRVADVDTIIDFDGCTNIPEELCQEFKTLNQVIPGDIVFTKGGSVARIGLITIKSRCKS